MTFLEAHRIVSSFAGGEALPFLLAMSGTGQALHTFVRAAAALRGRSAIVRTLPFNTLAQALLEPPRQDEREVFLLFPWDFVPEADWRSGLPPEPPDDDAIRAHARAVADRLSKRPGARLLYVPAAVPPIFMDAAANRSFAGWIAMLACSIGAEILAPEVFSIESYLANGGPIAGAQLGTVADAVVAQAAAQVPEPCKVLVTDLDNVMWHGVIGEDGLEGIHCAPEGIGFRFFLYQTLLARLRREGTLLAAVSRNDPDLARAPFRAGRTLLVESDFVCIAASYQAKSAQIADIASRLNLGLDSFVFVDDNPIELAEVGAQSPAVRLVRFADTDAGVPRLFGELSALCARPVVTEEDRQRTELYRRRLAGVAPSTARGADLTAFLRDLEMTLTIHDRSSGDRTRAVQLINKTNQFNLNGQRVVDEDVAAILAAGGRLLGASVSDRHGAHGEILACLVDAENVIRSLVMSCRVFQRRIEHAFLSWLAAQPAPPRALAFVETPRNEPIRQFLTDSAFTPNGDGLVGFDAGTFLRAHASDLELFRLAEPATR
jgi:FkbH-like protein